MSEKRFESFEEFWPFYVREHSNKTNRNLHFVGSTLAVGLVGYAALRRKLWPLAVAPVVGYGFAWVGHFFIEGNKPASFKYPLWSFRGDWKMWWLVATGRMDEEVVLAHRAEHAEEKPTHTNGATHPAE